jgi:hypothetical protein
LIDLSDDLLRCTVGVGLGEALAAIALDKRAGYSAKA